LNGLRALSQLRTAFHFPLSPEIRYSVYTSRFGGDEYMANEEKPKQKMGFTIIKDDPIDGHKGFGVGALSLENVSPVIIDVEEGTASIEIGAMHARSDIERGIKFTTDRAASEGGKPYWLVWVTIDFKEDGPYYAEIGRATSELQSREKLVCRLLLEKKKRRS